MAYLRLCRRDKVETKRTLGYNKNMDLENGGPSREEQQRRTAAEIARKKVLAAYSANKPQTSNQPATTATPQPHIIPVRRATPATATPTQPQTTPRPAPVTAHTQVATGQVSTPRPTVATNIDWQKYHNAWQQYYQKYYGEYYAKAALAYIEKEKMRQARALSDKERNEKNAIVQPAESTVSSEPKQVVEDSLRARVQKIVKKQQKKHLNKKLIPIFAGVFVVLLLLFLQYNRLIFAPIMAYVSPGNTEDTGISSVDPTVSVAISQDSRLMIPKLNIDVPVHFGISNDEVMSAMNNGVAQFSIPGANALPGQIGNLAISGHSAGDIYSSNQYKFIFSGLERLEKGDLIYIDYQGVRYTYKMVDRKEVDPSDVSSLVLNTDKPMLTLITCWPLGVSTYRLLIIAEQINPAPSGESQAEVIDEGEGATAEVMPNNEPTFFEGIWNWLTGN